VPEPSDPKPQVKDDRVASAALDLGWHMAEFYDSIVPTSMQPPATLAGPPRSERIIPPPREHRRQLQADLPGLSSLSDADHHQLLIDQIRVGASTLGEWITEAHLEPPALPELAELLRFSGDEGRYQLASKALTFHEEVLSRLVAANARLGKAYGLGRALADLTLRPNKDDAASFTKDLEEGRVVQLIDQLRELKSSLPPHSAEAVTTSMTIWQAWARSPKWGGANLDWKEHGHDVVIAFKAQGRRWRLLLSGEKDALDVLSAEDYVDAGGYLLGRLRQLLVQFALAYWPAVLALALFVILGAVAAAVFFNSPAAKATGIFVAVLSGLGISAASVGGAVRRVFARAGDSLWQAELDLAVARATTTLPVGADPPVIGEPGSLPVPRLVSRMMSNRARKP
jgi:hypothetical protein